jgi:hypothetical protein
LQEELLVGQEGKALRDQTVGLSGNAEFFLGVFEKVVEDDGGYYGSQQQHEQYEGENGAQDDQGDLADTLGDGRSSVHDKFPFFLGIIRRISRRRSEASDGC